MFVGGTKVFEVESLVITSDEQNIPKAVTPRFGNVFVAMGPTKQVLSSPLRKRSSDKR
jgi:hypothetical protein